MSRPRIAAALVASSLVAAACGDGGSTATEPVEDPTFPPDTFAIVANADIGTGTSRVLFGILEGGGRRIGSPDHPLTITASHTDTPDDTQTVDGVFTWIIQDAFGLYRAEFDFDRPGLWRAVVTPERGSALPDTGFNVLADPAAPAIGEVAPAPETPTSPSLPFEEITTDLEPDPRFYELSLDEAIGNGSPTVVIFSTPAYCQTATCGPLLDIVKGIAPEYPDTDFVHIEVYTNITDPNFAPVPENLAPSVGPEWWNLPSEPWVFVVDPNGIVIARFEGVMAAEELAAVL